MAIGISHSHSGGTALHGQNCWHTWGMAST
jgi:hypothetical protein